MDDQSDNEIKDLRKVDFEYELGLQLGPTVRIDTLLNAAAHGEFNGMSQALGLL